MGFIIAAAEIYYAHLRVAVEPPCAIALRGLTEAIPPAGVEYRHPPPINHQQSGNYWLLLKSTPLAEEIPRDSYGMKSIGETPQRQPMSHFPINYKINKQQNLRRELSSDYLFRLRLRKNVGTSRVSSSCLERCGCCLGSRGCSSLVAACCCWFMTGRCCLG